MLCFEHPVKPVVFLIHSHAHVQTNETCFPVICSSHTFLWTMSVRRYIPFPLACWGISELFCHTVSQFFSSLTQLAVMRKDLLTPNSVRVCYPEKRHTPPSHGERGVLNYICLQLRMCCGCNVTQANNGSETVKTKNIEWEMMFGRHASAATVWKMKLLFIKTTDLSYLKRQ